MQRPIQCLLPAGFLVFSAAVVSLAQTASAPITAPAATWSVPTTELNKKIPSWLSFSGEERFRTEVASGQGFKPNNSDRYSVNRFRFNLNVTPTDWLKFGFQTQDARALWKTLKPYAPPYQDTWDLTGAYAELGGLEKYHVLARIGRQSMTLGEGRLIGNSDWSNTGRAFDATRATFSLGGFSVDAFAATPVIQQDGQVGTHNLGNYVEGLYATIDNLLPSSSIQPYFFWRRSESQKMESGKLANEHFGIPGFRWTGELPYGFNYNSEVAIERGSIAADKLFAWASHIAATHAVPVPFGFPARVVAEFNFASGDTNSKDGVHGTFDTVYASSHDKYGLADQVGWKNIEHIRTGLEFNPRKKLSASLKYSDYWLADPHDALYNASGNAVARSSTGTAGNWVGQECDATASYSLSKKSQAGSGFGYLIPGTFLEKTTPGKSYKSFYLFYSTGF